ncbi:MAG TPA: alpha/beta hydrolase, partial [Terricaulis sp.]|nr:alpha/beta hydrolase [Terricaulis sp.]
AARRPHRRRRQGRVGDGEGQGPAPGHGHAGGAGVGDGRPRPRPHLRRRHRAGAVDLRAVAIRSASGGRFEDGTLSRWLSDTLAVLETTPGPLALVGSSMGGWIALLAARALPARVKGLLLIAPAADFTERLMWPALSPAEQQEIMEKGRIEQASQYSVDPNVLTRALIEDGRRHLLMTGPIAFAGPVRILQGADDPDVPLAHVQALAALMRADDLKMDIISGGDHRLSRPQDIAALLETADALAGALAR